MEKSEVTKIWECVKEELQKTVSDSHICWIDSLEPAGFEGDNFTLLTGQAFGITVIKKNCYEQFINAFRAVLKRDITFNIILDENLSKKIKKENEKIKIIEQKTESEKKFDNLAKMQSFANLNLKYKFENFVVGSNSEMAQAAAMAVAKNPAGKYNPLFIYGASGLGKTHLMQAIGHYILFNNKNNLRVKYLKTEEFTNELIDNIRTGKDRNERMAKFRQKYRNVDILLIDDIQFLEGKARTAEEIFHTFDYLHNRNKQIVITSDRPPKEIPELPERLVTRFEWGLTVDITPPDFETRFAILKNLAEFNNIPLSNDVLECIAKFFNKNVRELEGAFNKVMAYSNIKDIVPDVETAKRILKIDENKKEITTESIANVVCNKFGLTLKDMKSSSRTKQISDSRKIAIYLAREIIEENLVDIAEFFNKKHPTVVYAYETIKEKLKTDNKLNSLIKELKLEICGDEIR